MITYISRRQFVGMCARVRWWAADRKIPIKLWTRGNGLVMFLLAPWWKKGTALYRPLAFLRQIRFLFFSKPCLTINRLDVLIVFNLSGQSDNTHTRLFEAYGGHSCNSNRFGCFAEATKSQRMARVSYSCLPDQYPASPCNADSIGNDN